MTHSRKNQLIAFLSGLLVIASIGYTTLSVSEDKTPENLTETYADWKIICVTPKAAKDTKKATPKRLCEMAQELRNEKTNQRVIALSLQSQTKNEMNLTLISPFGLKLSEGIRLKINGAELLHLTINTCLPVGCISNNKVSKEKLQKLDENIKLAVHMKDVANRDIKINVSLSGFTPALKRLKKLNKT